MGLDTVEMVIRAEEVFSVDLPNEECGRVHTVGDLYRLILSKLKLPYISGREIEAQACGRDRSRSKVIGLEPWTTHDVWLTLKGIIWSQLQVDIVDIHEGATFNDDLRCD